MLAVSVWPASDQVLTPTVVVAADHEDPLSSETSTISPLTIFALTVPERVCAAMLVMKSDELAPASAEKATVAIVAVGVWLSTVAFVESTVVVVLPALSVAVTETLRFVALMAPLTIV